MINIEVTGKNETKKSKAGNDYTLQEGYAHVAGHKYPVRVELFPPKGAQPYAAGMYTLAPESVQVGEFGKLELRPVLVAVAKK